MSRCAAEPKTPVCVITGFLGSGKTTLRNALLKHPGMAETAVLVNEFGEIGSRSTGSFAGSRSSWKSTAIASCA